MKVNQFETQFIKEALEINWYREARAQELADVCVVNTCTVTAEGGAKSRQTIRRLHATNPAADIVILGCYATQAPASVTRLPGVFKVITKKTRLGEELQEFGVHVILRSGSRCGICKNLPILLQFWLKRLLANGFWSGWRR